MIESGQELTVGRVAAATKWRSGIIDSADNGGRAVRVMDHVFRD